MSEERPNQFHPTPEQLALVEVRRLKKLAKMEKAKQEEEERSRILPREWLSIQPPAPDGVSVKIMSWNLLAQCLIRRELFPTSGDCLKAAQREHMLFREILSHKADICCLQEVDRTERLFPVLEDAGYNFVYAAGPRKRHGCLVAFHKDVFSTVRERTIFYDDQEVREAYDKLNTHGSSFRTRNICSLVALQRAGRADTGVIVATTHLFWHPGYIYERARQAGILLREAAKFRHELGKDHWPCVIAGDFNFTPEDPVYSLLIGDSLLPEQRARLAPSRVVHVTIDPSVPVTTDKMMGDDVLIDEEEGAETDPDRIITNAREAREEDGLLDDVELTKLFNDTGHVFSAYDRGLRSSEGVEELTYGSRVAMQPSRSGGYEPLWTSYTHYWKTVLDYIFVLEPVDRPVLVTGLAKPIFTADLEPGLPQKGKCGSDHISLCAELSWPEPQPTPSS
ncbi:unnamed protein product [Somion occarium]|uniref:Endonuclease/exonuclease/phosphatase domain-containing protein n=1 Tax=Somion occarium TaxID=3059160 RepID=A0ABP1CLE7_9APHY